MDLRRAAQRWYEPGDFVRELLPGTGRRRVDQLGSSLTELLAYESLVATDPKTLEVCERWDAFCTELFHAYQDEAVSEVEAVPSRVVTRL